VNTARLAVAFCLFGAISRAAPAQSEQSPKSPDVHDDGTVTFRVTAPDAAQVALSAPFVEEGAGDMERDADGLWSITVGPVPAGIHGYKFLVDGLSIVDPGNHDGRLGRWPESFLLIRGETPAAYELQGAPQGVLHAHGYTSTALGIPRRAHVYTPPGYSADRTYPVVYLLHGFGDNDSSWSAVGRANIIADNLLAQGRIEPMIVVMPHGHVAAADMTLENWQGERGAFEADLMTDVMPLVEANYSVRPGADSTAIVGLSMGGGQSLSVGLSRLDTFGWIGAFSAAPRDVTDDERLADLLAQPDKPHLVWVGCGTDDFLFERNEKFLAWLTENGVAHTAHITDGGHTWPIWREYLEEFLPLIFRD
jgi:enterochelin esterase-like enzyme